MANASVTTNKVEKTIVVEEEVITLALNRAEATILMDIFSRIGGDPETTRRGLVDNMNDALRKIGVWGTDQKDMDDKNRAIYFNEVK